MSLLTFQQSEHVRWQHIYFTFSICSNNSVCFLEVILFCFVCAICIVTLDKLYSSCFVYEFPLKTPLGSCKFCKYSIQILKFNSIRNPVGMLPLWIDPVSAYHDGLCESAMTDLCPLLFEWMSCNYCNE